MAHTPGNIPVNGKFVPINDTDTYAISDTRYGQDGLRNVDSIADLNLIPEARRRAGMICGVLVTGITGTDDDVAYYKLLPGTWVYDETDWQQLSFGSSVATTFDDFIEDIFYNRLIVGANYKFEYDLFGTGTDNYYFTATSTDSSTGSNGAKIYAIESGEIMFTYLDSIFDTVIDQIYFTIEGGGNLVVMEPGIGGDPLVIVN